MICYKNPIKYNFSFVPVVVASLIMLLIVTVICKNADASSGLFISEVCPHNDEVIYDSVGFFHDFIKIENPSSIPINLFGFGLSDDSNQLGKYIFPDVTLESGESITVWADEKTVFGKNYSDDEALYAGFRLNDRDCLYLTNSNGQVIDSLRLPKMKRNMSLLRNHQGDSGEVGTPSDLDIENVMISDMILPPKFSATSGYYNEPFFLSIDAGGNTVYFTIDASCPYTSGIKYEDKISVFDRSPLENYYSTLGPVSLTADSYIPAEPVSKATVVRAVAQKDDGTFSRETVAVYFVGENIHRMCERTYTLSVVSDPQGLFSGKRGIYVTGNVWDMNKDKISGKEVDLHEVPVNYKMKGRGWRREARLTLFDEKGVRIYDEDGLISIRGGYGRSVIQKGFNIRPLETAKKVFDGLFNNSGSIISLRTGSETDVYKTNFRDALNNRIAKNLAIAAQRSYCCQVYLDGEYWGCYNLQEHMDETFVEGRYSVPAENVNIIKFNGEPVAESGLESDLSQYFEVKEYVDSHDLSEEENYVVFCNMVDIDSLIDYYCTQLFFGNDDGYIYNNAMWRAREAGSGTYEDGKWRFLLFDLDNTDGYGSSDGTVDPFTDMTWINSDQFFLNLSNNATFRRRFCKRMNELLDGDFSYESISPIIDEFETTYTDAMVLSVRRFHDPHFTKEQYAENVQVVRDFFMIRGKYISKYLKEHMGD